MATTQYKDNAEHIYEFQQEIGDAGGAERRPVAGMPAAVRTQLTDMAAALAGLASTVLGGVLKVVLQAGTAVIGKLGPNAGVNIGTVDVASGSVTLGASVPAGSAHIGSVAVDAALPAGTNAIGKLAANVGVNVGTVDINNALQLPPSLGQRNKATSLGVTIASDQSPLVVADGGAPLMVIGNGGNPLPVQGTVNVGNTVVANLGTSLPAGNANIGDVDIASMPPLPAGTNAIGKLAANQGVNIGTVDVAAPATAAVNVIGYVTTAFTLAAANAARVGLLVVNNTQAKLWLRFGSSSDGSNWSVQIEPGGYWEMPRRYYTGIVTAIWENITLFLEKAKAADGPALLAFDGVHVTET